MNKNLYERIDKVLLSNTEFMPEYKRRKVVEKIVDEFLVSLNEIKWIDIIKMVRDILENNKSSLVSQAVYCVVCVRKFIKGNFKSYY